MDRNQNFAIGDRVRQRYSPGLEGEVWSIERGVIIVKWSDLDENAYIRDPSQLEKVTPRRPATSGSRRRRQARDRSEREASRKADFDFLSDYSDGFTAEYVASDNADYVDYITPSGASDCVWMVPGSAR
jgi:hypothetical protein